MLGTLPSPRVRPPSLEYLVALVGRGSWGPVADGIDDVAVDVPLSVSDVEAPE